MTTFCIVTPSYNQAQFLKETIDSVLSQKGNFSTNYIVMDGGSSDGSVEILRSYGEKLEWVSEKDAGQSDALNKGIRHFEKNMFNTTDDCIFAYLNSDDYYLPTALAQVEQAFALNPDKEWLVGDARIVNTIGMEIQQPVRWYKSFWRKLYSTSLLHVLNPIPQPAVFIRAQALRKTGLFDQSLQYVMDYDYWQRLQAQFGNPFVLNKALAAFRIHGDSKGGTAFEKQFTQELAVAKKYSQSSVLLLLHKLHNELILAVYRLIK